VIPVPWLGGVVRRAFPIGLLVLAFAAGAAGCSSGSSGGGSAPSASPATTGVDRGAVDAALDQVLHALTVASAVGADTSLTDAASALNSASADLSRAARWLSPPPLGVPSALAAEVASSLTAISGDLDQAAACLREPGSALDPRHCLPPLRAAQQHDTAISHQLILLAAYGTRSPQAFEHDLAQALRGGS